MSTSADKQALLAIRTLKARVATLERARTQPVAIIGIGCRLPGSGRGPERLWARLLAGQGGTGEVPIDRYAVPGGELSATRYAGLLDDITGFDAEFFGISGREATTMDPQQRLMLEVAWDGLEDAGVPVESLRGSATGVFVGVCLPDYAFATLSDPEAAEAWASTGAAHSIVANRLSFWLDLRGPSVAVDTACSSSLVAVHAAVTSLRAGECDLAVAGGVNAIVSPRWGASFARYGMLSPTGRCRTFDAGADGFVRGEGAGVVILKRLDDARRDGDRIVAVIRGSAINQDGRSNGLTAPNGGSQRAVIGAALAAAGVEAAQIGYVEAHGTGTALGDPIEVEALRAVLGDEGPPCYLGALKSNIGHLESAAGIAGLIKASLCVQAGTIPPNLHFERLNPHIDLEGARLRVPTAVTPWAGPQPRRAGVSSFGFGGTNAHVVLEQAPTPELAATDGSGPWLVPISAASETALHQRVRALYEAPPSAPLVPLGRIAATAGARRSHLPRRMAVVAADHEAWREQLGAFLEGAPLAGARGEAPERRARRVFAFVGQGVVRAGMGLGLQTEPIYAEALARCHEHLRGLVPWSLLDELAAPPERSRLVQTEYAQPCLLAVQVALVELLRAWGVTAEAVLGHSVGELAAAWVAGVLTLPEALGLAAARGQAMQAAPRGAMLAVRASAEAVAGWLAEHPALSLAAINGPQSCVVAGARDDVEVVAQRLEGRGTRCRRLAVEQAFHHPPHLAPLMPRFRQALGSLRPRSTTLPLASTALGEVVDGTRLDAEYWVQQVLQPVRFADAVGALVRPHDVVIELGPHPALVQDIDATLVARSVPATVLSTLRHERGDRGALLETAAALHVRGQPLRWSAINPPAPPCDLPRHPWQRQRRWFEAPGPARSSSAAPAWARWLYTTTWVSAAPGPERERPEPASGSRPWVVLGEAELSAAVVREAAAMGVEARAVAADDPCALDRIAGAGVLCLWGLEPGDDPEATADRVGRVFALLAAIARGGGVLALATRGGVAVEAGPAPSMAAAALWGVARTIAAERPELWHGIVDVDAGDPPVGSLARTLATALVTPEAEAAWRDDQRWSPRLQPLSLVPRGSLPAGAVLITGGTGGVGLAVAEALVEAGVQELWLGSRRGPDARAQARLEALRARGARLHTPRVDAADPEALGRLLERIAAEGEQPLTMLVHAAGVLDDAPVLDHDRARFERIAAPKLVGATALLQRAASLERVVLVSSAAASLGSPGQAGYAGANAALEVLAARRRGEGHHAVAVAFGPWAEAGMAHRLPGVVKQRLERQGLRFMAPDLAAAALVALLRSDDVPASVLVADVDWARWAERAGAGALVRALVERSGGSVDTGARPLGLREGTPDERRPRVEAFVRREVGRVLAIDATAVPRDRGLFDLGLDSLMATTLLRRLAEAMERSLPPTLIYDAPTIEALTARLLDEPAEGSEPTAAAASISREPIAIVGMSCRLPGADDPEALWALLVGDDDPLRPIPRTRFDVESIYDPRPGTPGRCCAREAGLIDDVDRFDAALYGIPPAEAAGMDPQQRLLLEQCWVALEDAGLAPGSLRGSQTGIFVAVGAPDYALLCARSRPATGADVFATTGTAPSVASGRLAHLLGVSGPTLTVDTACSSSLVALHLARKSLLAGECDRAIVAGANLLLAPDLFVSLSQAGALSPRSRSHTFDASADGYVRAEGVIALVLSRRSDARAAGHRVVAEILGSAVNHDGRAAGLTVPSGSAQEAVLRAALRDAGVQPGSVGLLEAHGTGTALGDPIEVAAIARVHGGERAQPLALTALKARVGHLESAAGLGGVLSAALAVERGRRPGNPRLGRINPRIDVPESAVRFVRDAEDWPTDGGPRRAGVSAFGLSGTNAHVILEQASAPEGTPSSTEPEAPLRLLPLAARSEEGRRRLAGRWAEALQHGEHDWADVCWTAGVGRDHGAFRLGVLAQSAPQAARALAAVAEGETSPDCIAGEAVATPRVVFLYPGQAPLDALFDQLDRHPALGEALERLAPGLRERDRLHTGTVQQAVVALAVAMTERWRAWGVHPHAVMGHSVGELAAAWAAGVYPWDAVARLVQARGDALDPIRGTMLAVFGEPGALDERLQRHPSLGVAAINGPREVVISGPAGAIADLRGELDTAGIRHRTVNERYAFHSAAVDEVRAPLERAARSLTASSPRLTWVSSLTGRTMEQAPDPEHWGRHARRPVRWLEALQGLHHEGARVFLELGPGSTVSTLGSRAELAEARFIATADKDGLSPRSELTALARLFVAGVDPDWTAVGGGPRRRLSLPSTPFERRRYWLPTDAPAQPGSQSLAGQRLRSPLVAGAVRVVHCSPAAHPLLEDHRVHGRAVVAGAVHVAWALHLVEEVMGPGPRRLEAIRFPAALVLPEDEPHEVQIGLQRDGDVVRLTTHGRQGDRQQGEQWIRHFEATLADGEPRAPVEASAIADASGPQRRDGAEHREALAALAVRIGPRFDFVEQARGGSAGVVAQLRAPRPGDRSDLVVAAGRLDACFQLTSMGLPEGPPWVPVGLEQLWWSGRSARGQGECRLELALPRARFTYVDEGGLLWSAQGLTLAAAPAEVLLGEAGPAAGPRGAWRRALLDRPAGERRAALLDRVLQTCTEALGGVPLAAQTRLFDAGLDSLLAVELRNTIQAALDVTLPGTALLEYPTPDELVDHLLAASGLAPTEPSGAATPNDGRAGPGEPDDDILDLLARELEKEAPP